MKQGDSYLNTGYTIAALWHFFWAACWHNPQSCEAWQLVGVCLRILHQYSLARAVFCRAYRLAKTDKQRAKVLRDDSKIALAHKSYQQAIRRLERARKLLASKGEPLAGDDYWEYWITCAYLYDVHRRAGDVRYAYALIHRAWFMLKGHTPYELNALVRLVAAERWHRRTDWLPLAFRLAADNRKRRLQLRLICISAKLADILFP